MFCKKHAVNILKVVVSTILMTGCFSLSVLAVEVSAPTATTATATATATSAANESTTSIISDADREKADADLLYYMNSMQIRYTLNQVQLDRLGDMFNSAVYYIAYTDMTKAELNSYVASIQGKMESVATTDVSSTTSEFVKVADNWRTPTVGYGQKVSIVLPIINLGTEELNDLVIEPVVTNDVTTWPFEPGVTGYVQTEPFIPGYINDDQAFANRREFTYNFTVRDNVMTGYYPLKFKVSYTRAGVRVANDAATELVVYVQTIGKPESGFIGGNGHEDKVAKSKIIVTGYETDLEKVYSGDTFALTIHVQNTSATSEVSNILFNIKADSESTSTANSTEVITPFIPTSGSNSVYVDSIGPKESADIVIEMSAKAGLSQRSYALSLDMTYDSGTQFDLTDKASISIPVYQESKFDTSTIEVAPASINVGSQANIMFSIYNTGKTTLYNVQVQFEADSIENNMAFVGNLNSGATGNVDVMITGIAPTMDDGTVKAIISYEDEAGNESFVEKPLNLFVSEVQYEDFDMDSGMREPMEEEKTISPVLIAAIIGAIIVVVFFTFVIIITRNRKKKANALNEDDILDLDALETDTKNDEVKKPEENDGFSEDFR